MTNAVRIALIGCGRIAQVAHLPAIEKADGIDLVAVSDRSDAVTHAIARRYDVPRAYLTAEEVWNDPDVEAVLVAAPDRFHFDLAGAALRAGRHVLVEKPLAATVEQCGALVDLVAQTGLKLQVGAMKRHDAGLQFARRFVGESLGEPRSFSAWYRIGDLRAGIEATLFPRVYADPEARQHEAGFKSDRQRYLLATHGAHIYDTVRYLLGDVEAIDARHRGYDRDHAWSALVTMASGAVGTVSISADVPGVPAEGIEVFGSTGSVRVETPFPFYRQASTVRAYTDGQVVVPVLTDGDAYERQVEAFGRAIRDDLAPDPGAVDGLAAVALIEATAVSAEAGREVRLL
jgi:predicted dehydrogenase